MNKIVLLLLASCCWLHSQPLEYNDPGIYVSGTHFPYLADATDFLHLDFRNTRAVDIGEGWQALRDGKGKSIRRNRNGDFQMATEVTLEWQHALDSEHWVVAYTWFWTAASSSSEEIVQLFEAHEGSVYITQQIRIDTHHGGRAVGARFEEKNKLLTAKAVSYVQGEGRCCPSLMSAVSFRWDGQQFRRVHAKRVPLPKGDSAASLGQKPGASS